MEKQRLAFIEQRDGKEAAIDFARRTLRQYRKAVLMKRKQGEDKFHFASLPEFRESFIKSYLCFKRYLKENLTKTDEVLVERG